MSMRSYYYRGLRDRSLSILENPRKGSLVVIRQPDHTEIKNIAQELNLDFPDLDDVFDNYEIPRLERHGKTLLIFLRTPLSQMQNNLSTQLLVLILSENNLYLICPEPNLLIEDLLAEKLNITTTQKSKLLVYILLQIARRYTYSVKLVHEIIHDQKRIKKINSLTISSLQEYEDILSQYLLALTPMQTIFETILSGKHLPLYQYDQDILEDLLIATKQSVNIAKATSKSIVTLRDTFQIIFTNQLNRSIQILTSLTLILTIPTITASIFGMNVTLPLQENPWAFLIILAISVLISVLLWILFLFKRWL